MRRVLYHCATAATYRVGELTTNSPVDPGPYDGLVGVGREGALGHEPLGAPAEPCRRNRCPRNASSGRDDEAVEPPDVVPGVAVRATEPRSIN